MVKAGGAGDGRGVLDECPDDSSKASRELFRILGGRVEVHAAGSGELKHQAVGPSVRTGGIHDGATEDFVASSFRISLHQTTHWGKSVNSFGMVAILMFQQILAMAGAKRCR